MLVQEWEITSAWIGQSWQDYRRFFCSTPRLPFKPERFKDLTGRLTGGTVVFCLEFEFDRFFPVTGETGLPEPDGGGFIRPVGKKNPGRVTLNV